MDNANAVETAKALKAIFSDAYKYMKKWLDPVMLGRLNTDTAREMCGIADRYADSPLADFASQLMIDAFHTIGRAHGNLAAGRRKEQE